MERRERTGQGAAIAGKTVDDWVMAVQHGAQEKLTDVVRHYEPLVRSLARRMNISWEDACQEGRLAVIEAVYRFDPAKGCYFGAYVKRRVWAALRTLQRREWRWQAESYPSMAREEDEGEWWERLPAGMSECWDDAVWMEQLATLLSAREYLVIARHVIEGQTLGELATAEGVSVETVKTWKRRALQKLRRYVEPLFCK
jgi:RNA polymerase sigma factor (sigma-70 family)